VNDKPYELSSFLSVAMGRALGTALTGGSKGNWQIKDCADSNFGRLIPQFSECLAQNSRYKDGTT